MPGKYNSFMSADPVTSFFALLMSLQVLFGSLRVSFAIDITLMGEVTTDFGFAKSIFSSSFVTSTIVVISVSASISQSSNSSSSVVVIFVVIVVNGTFWMVVVTVFYHEDTILVLVMLSLLNNSICMNKSRASTRRPSVSYRKVNKRYLSENQGTIFIISLSRVSTH